MSATRAMLPGRGPRELADFLGLGMIDRKIVMLYNNLRCGCFAGSQWVDARLTQRSMRQHPKKAATIPRHLTRRSDMSNDDLKRHGLTRRQFNTALAGS